MRTRLCLALVAVVSLVALGRTPVGAVSLTFTVNTTASDDDGTCAPVTALTDCTLREAINAANANPDKDTIAFDIPGTAPHTITVTSQLPNITGPVVLDGTTEPDFAGAPVVEVSGGGTVQLGLILYGGDSVVRGLVVNRFAQGIWITPSSPGGDRIEGNYIGTTVDGTAAAGNTEYGIVVRGRNTTVGGTTTGTRNVISGNDVGLSLSVGSGGTVVQGNLIGTDPTGLRAIPNRTGLQINADDTTVGGTSAAARNVVSGNQTWGIRTTSHTGTRNVRNVIQGNYIGVDATGSTALSNGDYGIEVVGDDNTIGGSAPGAGNVVAHNGARVALSGIAISGERNTVRGNTITGNRGSGVQVSSGTGNTISRNAISANGSAGVELGANANDTKDADTGPNGLQNFPVLAVATVNGGATHVLGSLNSTPSATFTVELFASAACDTSGFGEGARYLGNVSVTTDASGDAPIAAAVAAATVGEAVTATATDAAGNTSEFSACRTATPPPSASVADVSADEGEAAAFTVSLSGPSAQTVTVGYATGDDTAKQPGDYTAKTGTLTFVPGDTSESVSVATVEDTVYEGSQTFTLDLSSPSNATIADGKGVATIVDDDAAPTVSVVDTSMTEGDSGIVLGPAGVALSKAAEAPVSVTVTTSDGTAAAGTDYTARSGTVTFEPGQTGRHLNVSIIPDDADEPDETVVVTLSDASGATIADGEGTLTIVDDDENHVPVANAGADQTVGNKAAFTLDASGSTDADGQSLTYSWEQIGGPPATIRDPEEAVTDVDGVSGPATLTFRVTVTDSAGGTSTDEVVVTVKSK